MGHVRLAVVCIALVLGSILPASALAQSEGESERAVPAPEEPSAPSEGGDAAPDEGAGADDASAPAAASAPDEGAADTNERAADDAAVSAPDEGAADDAAASDEQGAEVATDEPAEPSGASEGGASDAEHAGDSDEEAEHDGGYTFRATIGGEYRHRFVAMSDIPLEPLPRTDPAASGRLGQNYWGEQWLRLHGELALRPILRLYGETDLLWGVAYGDLAMGTAPAQWGRDSYGYPGLRLRQLYLDWLTPIGLVRVGQTAFQWGLGMVSNDGAHAPVFGDYRFGDLVRRVMFATRPAGEDSAFTIAIAGDWVAWDQTADFDRRGDLAFQGVLAGLYEENDDRAGIYVAYRNQQNPQSDSLEVFVADAFADLRFDEPSGGKIVTAFELAYIRGSTSYTRTFTHPVQDVEQLMAVGQIGRTERHVDVMFEGGYASGDSNTTDGIQRTATMDPDHRVGLILFPEVIAWQTARSAFLAQSPDLFGHPARGSQLLPTNGGVSGAYYLFPYVMWRPLDWIETRAGGVIAWSSTDVVDPYAQQALSQSVNYRGGDPTRRDLGLELDGSVLLHGPIAENVILSGGIEGGVFFPGHAFDDAAGRPMDPVGMGRVRLGIRY